MGERDTVERQEEEEENAVEKQKEKKRDCKSWKLYVGKENIYKERRKKKRKILLRNRKRSYS